MQHQQRWNSISPRSNFRLSWFPGKLLKVPAPENKSLWSLPSVCSLISQKLQPRKEWVRLSYSLRPTAYPFAPVKFFFITTPRASINTSRRNAHFLFKPRPPLNYVCLVLLLEPSLSKSTMLPPCYSFKSSFPKISYLPRIFASNRIERGQYKGAVYFEIRGTYLRYSKKSKEVRYLDGCDRACCPDDSADDLSHCSFIAVVLGAVYIAYRSCNINQDAPGINSIVRTRYRNFIVLFFFFFLWEGGFPLIFNLCQPTNTSFIRFFFLSINFSLPFNGTFSSERVVTRYAVIMFDHT